MKLYTRLIEEGTFIFWNYDGPDTNLNLKISIIVGEDKVDLVDINPDVGKNYYVFENLGTGDYLIELNAFREDKIYQTETKKIKIKSSTVKSEENFKKLIDELQNINSNLSELLDQVRRFRNELTDPESIVDIRERVDWVQKGRW